MPWSCWRRALSPAPSTSPKSKRPVPTIVSTRSPGGRSAERTALDSASRPPIQLVTIGSGERKHAIGNETVLFRHEKTFIHEPALMVRLRAAEPKEQSLALVAKVEGYSVERIGSRLRLNGFALDGSGVSADDFAEFVGMVKARTTSPLALISDDPAAMAAALEKLPGATPS